MFYFKSKKTFNYHSASTLWIPLITIKLFTLKKTPINLANKDMSAFSQGIACIMDGPQGMLVLGCSQGLDWQLIERKPGPWESHFTPLYYIVEHCLLFFPWYHHEMRTCERHTQQTWCKDRGDPPHVGWLGVAILLFSCV